MHEYFLGIQGQESALNILTEIYNNKRIPHALLFSGIEGSGKFQTALQFIKLLNSNASAASLKKIESLSEPYIKLIMPLPRGKSESNSDLPTSKLTQDVMDEIQLQIKSKIENPFHKISIKSANNIKISSIRQINKIVSLNFDEIPYRAIIISEAHKMSVEAQNAFLKNLEEPPEGIIYILLTDNPDYLLTTIKSRCWELNFSPLKDEELITILESRYNLIREEFIDVIPFAHGSVTNALFLIENDLKEYLNKTILILRYALARKYHTALTEFTEVVGRNSVQTYQIVLDLIIAWFNDSLKQKHDIDKLYFTTYKETLEKFNERFTQANVANVVSKLVEFRNAPSKNVSLNLLVMNVIFEIASIGMKRK